MRYPVMLLLLTLVAGCAQQVPRSTLENQFVRIAGEARPACTAGHENAISDGIVTIQAGETICINLEIRGQVVTLAGVTSVDSEKTLMLMFRRETEPASMVLIVRNPLDGFLRYKANMLLPGASKYEYTTICPVLSKRLGFEQWPHPIVTLKLTAFELVADTGNVVCQ